MRQGTLSAILIAVGVSLLLSYWYMVTPATNNVQGLVLTSVTTTLTATPTGTATTTLLASRTFTPTASPTYVLPTVVGMKLDPRCTSISIAGAAKYVLVGADSFLTVGSPQSPLTFSSVDRPSGLGLVGYCEVIVDKVRFFHKLPGTPTPTSTTTPTPTATRTPELPKAVAQATGCSALAGRFFVPQGTKIWYLSGGQFRPSAYGFRGGETLASPVEERDGRCKTNARSDAVGDWWFALADIQLPPAPPPALTSTPMPAAPAFGQTPITMTASKSAGCVQVSVEGTGMVIDTDMVINYLCAEKLAYPPKVTIHLRTRAQILAMFGPGYTAAYAPADDPRLLLSEKGVDNIYVTTNPTREELGPGENLNVVVAHELCRVIFTHVKGRSDAGGVTGIPGSGEPVDICDNQVAARYKFVK